MKSNTLTAPYSGWRSALTVIVMMLAGVITFGLTKSPASVESRDLLTGAVALTGLATLALLKMDWAIALMLLALSMQREEFSPVRLAIGSMRASELIAAGCIPVFFLASICGRERFGKPVNRSDQGATWFIILFLAVMLMSSIMSALIDSTSSNFVGLGRVMRERPFIKSYTTVLAYLFGIAIFYVLTLRLQTPQQVRRGLRWWVFGGVAAVILALYGLVGSWAEWPWAHLIGVSPRGIDATEQSIEIVPRLRGLTMEARHLAIYLGSVLPFLVTITCQRVYIMRPLIQWGCMVLLTVGFMMTYSRSTLVLAVAILVAVLLVVGFLCRRALRLRPAFRFMMIALIAMLVANVVLVVLGLPNIADFAALQYRSLFDTENYSNWQATEAYAIAFRIFSDYPVLGVGIGNFSFYVDRYIRMWNLVDRSMALYQVPPIVSNIYLELAAETGVIGLAALLAMLGYFLVCGIKATRESNSEWWRIVRGGLVASYLVMLAAFNLTSAFFFAFVWALIGLMQCAIRVKDHQES